MTNVEKVQLLIGDTGTTQFTVLEIEAFLAMSNDSVYEAAALALESWAATLTEDFQMERIGDYEYRRGQSMKKLDLAARYRSIASNTPAIDFAQPDYLGVREDVV